MRAVSAETVMTGVICVAVPVEACISFAIKVLGDRHLLIMERDALAVPVFLKPAELGNVYTGLSALARQSFAAQDASAEDQGLPPPDRSVASFPIPS